MISPPTFSQLLAVPSDSSSHSSFGLKCWWKDGASNEGDEEHQMLLLQQQQQQEDVVFLQLCLL